MFWMNPAKQTPHPWIENPAQIMTEIADPASGAKKKLWPAYALATGLGIGYIPLGPGTWGAMEGAAIYILFSRFLPAPAFSAPLLLAAIFIALAGVWAADKVESQERGKDPSFVVVDEISGQFLTFLFAGPLGWKSLLAGFILFRVFDITKPFPIRRAEKLPGGWGIMADDWLAAIYAAGSLWVLRGFGLPD
jgi:phosphatidylglycerophosphatase A